ncbi:MAG TPA: GGDEF domain-containing protein [Burkholderiaceae bacterium]|nr:GGDEF domain-containing protein [Burkholderiaceae bacterium]
MKSNLSTRLALVLAMLGMVVAGLTGWYVYGASRDLLVQAAQSKLLTATRVMARRITATREELSRDLQLLALHPDTSVLLGVADPTARLRLEAMFGSLLTSNPSYLQVRLIGAQDHGLERVRVDRHNGLPLAIGDADLQEKGHFDYVAEALKVAPGQTYLSRIAINREAGVHAGEGLPTLVASMTVRDAAGTPRGVVVINIDLRSSFESMRMDLPETFHLFFANSKGDWLIHPDASLTFGFDRGQRHLAQDTMPQTAALLQGAGDHAVFETTLNGQALAAAFIASTPVVEMHDTRLLLGLAQPLKVVLADVTQLNATIWKILIAVGVACLLVAWVLARTLVRPLAQIGAAARQFAQGQVVGALPLSREDEIGDLARTFDRMQGALAQQLKALEDSQHELSTLARQDGLTGLANRRQFHDSLQSALAQRRRTGQVVALLYVDLDKFKLINDTHGHEAGDAVLLAVAQRLRANTREVDTPARLGGDEFAVVVAQAPEDAQLAALAAKLVEAVAEPIEWKGQWFRVACSMGIARTPADGETEEQLMSAADTAMYVAKQAGQGGFRFHGLHDGGGLQV